MADEEEWDDNYEPEGEYDPETDGQIEPEPPDDPPDWSDAEESSDVIPEGEPVEPYLVEESRETWWYLASGGTVPAPPETEDATTTPTGWTTTRPTVTSDATAAMRAYECDRIVYGDGSCVWGEVSVSVSYDNEAKAWLASKVANEANTVANATAQHFWHDSEGVHVVDEEQANWATEYAKTDHGELSNPTSAKPWHNQLINSLGTLIRTGLRNLVSITRSAIAFYDGQGNNTENIIARFGANGAQIGKSGQGNAYIDSTGLSVHADSTHEVMSAKSMNDPTMGVAVAREVKVAAGVVGSTGCAIATDHGVTAVMSCYVYGTTTSVSLTIDPSDNTILYCDQSYLDKRLDVIYTTRDFVASVKVGALASANGPDSLAVGESETYGFGAIAFGAECSALGNRSIVGGTDSDSVGRSSVAIGEGVKALADGSAAFGMETVANGRDQFVIGEDNVIDTSDRYAFIVGNGDSSTRSNAFTVGWNGDIYPSKRTVLKSLVNRDNPSGTAISDNDHSVYITDADGERIGIVRVEQSTGGNITLSLMSIGEKTDGTEVINQISLNSLRDGSRTYYVADPAAFRSAISAFSTSGGTITGPVYAKNTVIDRSVSPSSAQYTTDVGGGSSFQLVDKNGAVLGYIRASKQVDGRTGLDLRVWNSDTAGSNVVHGAFQIFIDRSGTVSYSIANQANFRNAIGASSGIFPRSAGGTGMSARTTGTVTRSGVTTAGTFNAYSNGVVCTVTAHDLALKTALANGENVNIGTLPEGYRPPTNMYGTIHGGASSRNNKGFIRITSDGVVRFSNYSDASWATNYTIAFTITWAL